MGLAEKMKAEREKKGWSQSDLARAARIPQPTIWRLETGAIGQPKADTLIALAKAFKVPVDYLVQDEYDMRPADMLRSDRDLREMVSAYLALSNKERGMVNEFVRHLKGVRRPWTSIAVKPRRVRKE